MGSDKDFDHTVGINLRAMRTAKGFKIAEVSRITGINKTVLDNIELGERSLNYENLYKLSKFYGVQMEEIIEVDPENLSIAEGVELSDEEKERELLKARYKLLTDDEKKFIKNVLELLKKLEKNVR